MAAQAPATVPRGTLAVPYVIRMRPFQEICYVINQVIGAHGVHTIEAMLATGQLGVGYRLLRYGFQSV